MKIVRHGVFETNSSSTHSMTFSKTSNMMIPAGDIEIKMRTMGYLHKIPPSYLDLPDYEVLKDKTTQEVIELLLTDYKGNRIDLSAIPTDRFDPKPDNEMEIEWRIDGVVSFLNIVGIDTGFSYSTNWCGSSKWERETRYAVAYLKDLKNIAAYPQFDAEKWAPECRLSNKLDFIYCIAMSSKIDYDCFINLLLSVNAHIPGTLYIELLTETVSVMNYTADHHYRTLAEMERIRYDYPLYMEMHSDMGNVIELIENEPDKIIEWLFDSNSGFYRWRDG